MPKSEAWEVPNLPLVTRRRPAAAGRRPLHVRVGIIEAAPAAPPVYRGLRTGSVPRPSPRQPMRAQISGSVVAELGDQVRQRLLVEHAGYLVDRLNGLLRCEPQVPGAGGVVGQGAEGGQGLVGLEADLAQSSDAPHGRGVALVKVADQHRHNPASHLLAQLAQDFGSPAPDLVILILQARQQRPRDGLRDREIRIAAIPVAVRGAEVAVHADDARDADVGVAVAHRLQNCNQCLR